MSVPADLLWLHAQATRANGAYAMSVSPVVLCQLIERIAALEEDRAGLKLQLKGEAAIDRSASEAVLELRQERDALKTALEEEKQADMQINDTVSKYMADADELRKQVRVLELALEICWRNDADTTPWPAWRESVLVEARAQLAESALADLRQGEDQQ